MIDFLQLVISVILFFVLLFGIGFILNMLIKTTWLPVWLYVFVLVPIVIYTLWEPGSLWDNLASYRAWDYLTFLGGLAGAVLSGVTIRTLRRKGYKMF